MLTEDCFLRAHREMTSNPTSTPVQMEGICGKRTCQSIVERKFIIHELLSDVLAYLRTLSLFVQCGDGSVVFSL